MERWRWEVREGMDDGDRSWVIYEEMNERSWCVIHEDEFRAS
jgi:hypothetical protein